MQSQLALHLVVHVVQDPKPDDRGQLMVAAITEGGHMVALVLSANWPKGAPAMVIQGSIALAGGHGSLWPPVRKSPVARPNRRRFTETP
jgi:hypothetical protein